jgi:hypothetical protein
MKPLEKTKGMAMGHASFVILTSDIGRQPRAAASVETRSVVSIVCHPLIRARPRCGKLLLCINTIHRTAKPKNDRQTSKKYFWRAPLRRYLFSENDLPLI